MMIETLLLPDVDLCIDLHVITFAMVNPALVAVEGQTRLTKVY
jgi:hypothetical protein